MGTLDTPLRRFIPVGLWAVVVLVLDQWTKWLVLRNVPEYGSIPVIPGFFDLVNIRNRGAAFGFLNRSDIEWQFWLFLGATCVAFGAIVMLVRTWPRQHSVLFGSLGLVLGGALGNLIDRVRYRAVVDFLDVYAGQWHWPAFNVADMAICCGAFLACVILWRNPETERTAATKKAASGGTSSRISVKKQTGGR